VFCHNVIHGLGFFIYFMIEILSSSGSSTKRDFSTVLASSSFSFFFFFLFLFLFFFFFFLFFFCFVFFFFLFFFFFFYFFFFFCFFFFCFFSFVFFFICYINLFLETFYCFAEISITDFFKKKFFFQPSLTKMSTKSNVAKNNNPRFVYGVCSDKPWVFDQSERAPSPIYIIIRL